MGDERVPVSEAEYQLLRLLLERGVEPGRWYELSELSRILGVERSRLEALARLLAAKGLLRVEEREETGYRVTGEAERYLREGFPEERLVRLLHEAGGELEVDEVRRRLGGDAAVALANAARKGWVEIRGGKVRLAVDPSSARAEERLLLQRLREGGRVDPEGLRLLRRRRLVEVYRRRRTYVSLADEPGRLLDKVVVEVGALTHELLVSGEWRRYRLREYDVAAEPPRLRVGRLNFFREFIEFIRDVMKEMGFVEVEQPPVVSEFWNYDALFQPQFHPARRPSDTFYLEAPPAMEAEEEVVERVRAVHEEGAGVSRGWRYRWDPMLAARLILRSHTTAVSARVLAGRPRRPFRFFTIGRVYRVEKIDARHLPEFHQVDGIASEEGTDFRWLLGILSEFLERLGFREYRFRPAYFPFTEPSVEGYVRIGDRWLEVLGAGMFRPEVLYGLGVDYPVAAWGMGIERLAMALYGVGDIRELYSQDVSLVERMPVRWRLYAGSPV
ncbi:MAG: phenylalanine--tRNA ligase subunit alpha [Crenarchaeota archaeon]|nr:phenylalanine--tRNA ligase subunit alpha [Thermoproteota archaeon]